jgi:hypothetical protein
VTTKATRKLSKEAEMLCSSTTDVCGDTKATSTLKMCEFIVGKLCLNKTVLKTHMKHVKTKK